MGLCRPPPALQWEPNVARDRAQPAAAQQHYQPGPRLDPASATGACSLPGSTRSAQPNAGHRHVDQHPHTHSYGNPIAYAYGNCLSYLYDNRYAYAYRDAYTNQTYYADTHPHINPYAHHHTYTNPNAYTHRNHAVLDAPSDHRHPVLHSFAFEIFRAAMTLV